MPDSRRRRVVAIAECGAEFNVESWHPQVIDHCLEAFTAHAEKHGLPAPRLEEEKWVGMSHKWEKQ